MESSHISVDDHFPIEELFHAYYDARKNKRNTSSQLRFELHLEENLVALYRDLVSRKYSIGTSICFNINDSVQREVFAADFRDRIVHHFLYNRLSPIFEKKFIYDSYSCRVGKGTLFGVRRLQHHIRSCSQNYSRDCYILKLDLSGYFMNIDRLILFSMIERFLPKNMPQREFILWLTNEIVMYEPVVNCHIKGNLSDWDGLPHEKSLFYAGDYKGMPIGNLTSQLFSNIYLNGFDNWVKRCLKLKHYGRYVDDFYVIDSSSKRLLGLIPVLSEFLKEQLGLTLHPRKMYLQHYSKGVRFLGCVVLPYRIVPASRMKRRMLAVFADSNLGILSPNMIRAKLNSYLGLMRHMSSQNFVRKQIGKVVVPYIHGYFFLSGNQCRYVLI